MTSTTLVGPAEIAAPRRFAAGPQIRSKLSRISQSRRNAVDCRSQRVVQFRSILSVPLSAQKLDLEKTHRINIRITQADRSREDRIVFQKVRLTCDAQNRLARVLAFGTGVQQDKVEALKWHWIAKSAGKGDTELDEYLADLNPADRAKAEEASRKWLGNK